jgi:nitrite reductase/ring-hydroxylating ferredoxin subunit
LESAILFFANSGKFIFNETPIEIDKALESGSMSEANFVASIKENKLKDGHMLSVNIKGNPILLAKVGGQIFGMSNKCPHMGCELHGGILNGFIVMCPCHGWKFDIRNGQYVDISEIALATYRCIVKNDKVHIEIKNEE